MAVTRINNNQVTDAITGNATVGINAGTKLQAYSITATRIANNLTYGSDLTISGNLTVSGTTTNVDTVNTLIQDPLITLADGQTSGAPTLDIGTIGLRGSENSAVLAWKESQLGFVTALSNTTVSNTTFNINSYANLQTGNFTVQGTTSLVGNIIGAVNATDTITGGNLATAGTASAGGNITGGNLLTGGLISATANVTGGNITTGGLVSATANVIGGNILTAGQVSATGNGTFGNISTAGSFGVATISASGNITGGNLLTGGILSATSNITGGNLITAGTVIAATVNAAAIGNADAAITAATVSAATIGNASAALQGATASLTANVTGGNILTGGQVSATANVTGGNLVSATVTNPTAMTVSTNSGNINISPNGNVVINSTYINGLLDPVQGTDAATKYYVDTIATTGITIHEAVFAATISDLNTATGGTVTYAQPNGVANGIGATLTTTGSYTFIDTANVQTVGTRILVKDQANAVQNGVYVYSNATVITRSTDTDQYGSNSSEEFSINDYFFTTNGNVNAGTAFVVNAPPGVITFGTSNISFGVFSQSQVYSANAQAGLILNGTVFSAKVDNNTTAFDGSGNIIVKAGANLTTPNIGAATGTSLSVTGTVTAASTVGGVITGTSASLSGNVTAGNITTGGLLGTNQLSLSGNVISPLNVTGNVTGGNILTAGIISTSGNVYAENILNTAASTQISMGNGSGIIGITSAANTTQFLPSGQINLGGVSQIKGGTFSGSYLTLGSSQTDLAQDRGGNVTVQVGTGGTIANTWTFTNSGNLLAPGNISAVGNITGANIVGTTSGTFGNIVISGDNITDTNGRVNFNTAGADVDFAVNGDTLANVFYVDAGTGTASFGSSTQTTNAIVAFNTTSSILIPAGNLVQRPGTGVTGMMRFNSTTNSLEIYNNTDWIGVGSTIFTVITDQQFNGDGATTAFTLANASTTAATIVSINGILQIPTSAYSVANVTLTFTEAPASGDLIDVRALTTTTTVTSIQNVSGNASIAVSDTSASIVMTGDLQVTGNVTVLGNVATDTILNGSSQVQIPDANQDIHFDVNGVNEVFLVGQFDSRFMGNVNPQANVTYNLGNTTNRWNDIWLASSTIYMGNATISANASSLIFTNPSGGQTVLAGATSTSSVAGNVTGGNIITGGQVSATGNISGANLIITGNIVDSSSSLNITTTSTNANIQLLPNGTGNVNIGANIMPTANATANIGSATLSYNTIFAKATSAQYADLAEKYTADAEYTPGTVLVFGGTAEVTVNAVAGDTKVAGVVSTNPSYTMNSGLESEHVATVALTGRVPTMVVGPVRKGDLMVTAGLGRAKSAIDPRVGSVIGKALEDFDGAEGTIEVVVGRF